VLLRPEGAAERSISTTDRHLVVSPLHAGTRLAATVTAAAGAASGPAAAAPSWVQPAAAPDAPSSATVTVVPGASALRVRWTPPPATDGPALTGFLVELRTVAEPATVAFSRSAPSSARSVDFPDLATGTRYFATVTAVSPAGAGAPRETATAVLRAATAPSCASCAAPSAQAPAVMHRPASAAATPAAVQHRAADAAAAPVPVSSGLPLRLAIGIGGILLAACLAIAAVLLRRRSALG
jgi:hypothetical protein